MSSRLSQLTVCLSKWLSIDVVDGHHRLEKAYRNGIPEIEAYFLPPEQHMPFLTTQKGYDAYVQYRNDKLDDDELDRRYGK